MMSSFVKRMVISAAAAASLVAGAASAQLLPGVGLPSLPPIGVPATGNVPVVGPVLDKVLATPAGREAIAPTLNSVSGLPQSVIDAGPSTLLELRELRHRELIRQYPRELESDGSGQPVRRGVLVAVDPDPVSLAQAARAGFAVIRDERGDSLGLRTVTFAVPRGLSARNGLKRLRRIAPALQADFDHLFEPAGGALLPFTGVLAASAGSRGGALIGIVDGGVASHPSLSGVAIEQNGFAGRPQPTGHGTAVASLIVGRQGPFQGAA
ncbi:MAG TPA: serine protease, partial [Sphingomicrobium sp.]|nr:serine protease [Sphingomicrobium sp.]